ncbi:hypothetical protein BVZ69_00289 [Haemophilus influenzae]|nr:hypothetical protein BVZ70_01844 [Haemophilus influenzae]PRM44247.1 hypothetical protein BVZ69_00289 [Haemophilus influenzae]
MESVPNALAYTPTAIARLPLAPEVLLFKLELKILLCFSAFVFESVAINQAFDDSLVLLPSRVTFKYSSAWTKPVANAVAAVKTDKESPFVTFFV